MDPAPAFVTSLRTPVTLTAADGKTHKPKLHDNLLIEGHTVRTGKDGYLFLALSNGAALGIGPKSQLRVDAYHQAPVTTRNASLVHEPTVSGMSIHLEHGTLAIVTNRLSPLSQARVALPQGELRIHSAICILNVADGDTQLSAYEGTLTYYYPDKKSREFLASPRSVRISEQSALRGRVAGERTVADIPESWSELAEATRHASRRVFFEASPTGGPARPMLIVSPDYFEQAPVRPYGFLE